MKLGFLKLTILLSGLSILPGLALADLCSPEMAAFNPEGYRQMCGDSFGWNFWGGSNYNPSGEGTAWLQNGGFGVIGSAPRGDQGNYTNPDGTQWHNDWWGDVGPVSNPIVQQQTQPQAQPNNPIALQSQHNPQPMPGEHNIINLNLQPCYDGWYGSYNEYCRDGVPVDPNSECSQSGGSWSGSNCIGPSAAWSYRPFVSGYDPYFQVPLSRRPGPDGWLQDFDEHTRTTGLTTCYVLTTTGNQYEAQNYGEEVDSFNCSRHMPDDATPIDCSVDDSDWCRIVRECGESCGYHPPAN